MYVCIYLFIWHCKCKQHFKEQFKIVVKVTKKKSCAKNNIVQTQTKKL